MSENRHPTEETPSEELKKVKVCEIWAVKTPEGNQTLMIQGPNDKTQLLNVLCDAVKIVASIEVKQESSLISRPGDARGFLKNPFFRGKK